MQRKRPFARGPREEGVTLRVVSVDDEPLVRERIRTLLAERDDVTLVAECGDGATAVRTIMEEEPDLVLLDVQMPELDGLEVVEALPADERPAIIFVTAYDEYAVRAFDVNAVDYLMKPLEPPRFHAALDRAVARRTDARAAADRGPAAQPELATVLREIRALRGYGERLVVRDGQRVSFVPIDDIDRIEAAGNYVRLHTGRTSLLMRESMKAVEARLDPDRFIRVHRSTIVNVNCIAHAEPHFHGEYVLTLRDGTRLTSSRSYSDRVRALLR
jgi:two-component system, LytTR family, response regulator